MSKGILPSYALITATRNASQFIDSTLKSMVWRTFRPLKWIIVSDGSTDNTDDIAAKYAENHPLPVFVGVFLFKIRALKTLMTMWHIHRLGGAYE